MKKIVLALLVFLALAISIFYFRNDIYFLYKSFFVTALDLEQGVSDFISEKIQNDIFLPPPLRADKSSENALLTKGGVIYFTNKQREILGLEPLLENPLLDLMAQAKMEDMFKDQYFAHSSPLGKGVGDIAKSQNYEFIVLGENLALGNFEDDEVLVQAWMDSLGHKENILNPKFGEIGVAVGRGTFEGDLTWIAVQHFGLPLFFCPSPDEKNKWVIEENEKRIESLEASLEKLKVELETIKKKKETELYLQKVGEYNFLVSQYNFLVSETKLKIDIYNSEIRAFNECIGKINSE